MEGEDVVSERDVSGGAAEMEPLGVEGREREVGWEI